MIRYTKDIRRNDTMFWCQHNRHNIDDHMAEWYYYHRKAL